MNKNEILEMSKKENKACDEREYQLQLRAIRMSRIFGVIIACIFLVIGTVFDIQTIGWTAMIIVCVMDLVQDLFISIAIKKYKWLTLIVDAVCLIIFTILLVFSII